MAVGAAIIILLLTEITQQLLDSLPRSPRCSWCPEDEFQLLLCSPVYSSFLYLKKKKKKPWKLTKHQPG